MIPGVTEGIARLAATREELLEAIAIRHEAFERTNPLVEFQAARLASRREHRAATWVLDRGDGTLVSTLLCYAFNLSVGGRIVAAYGLGSVGTRKAHRRKGYAAALCLAAIEESERVGRRVGLLYAAIAPAYYERLGFRALPASGFRCDRLAELASSGEAATLAPVDPRSELERLVADYAAFHEGLLHVHRGRSAFLRGLDEGSDEWFFRVDGAERGYVRASLERDGSVTLCEAVLLDPALLAPALRGLARFAADSGRKALTGWIEPPAELGGLLLPAPRDHDLPMLRGEPIESAVALWPSDHF